MKQRLIVVIYFALAAFLLFLLNITLAFSAAGWGPYDWSSISVLVVASSILITIGVKKHRKYTQRAFKEKPIHIDLLRVTARFGVVIFGIVTTFCILLSITLFIDGTNYITSALSLVMATVAGFATMQLHRVTVSR